MKKSFVISIVLLFILNMVVFAGGEKKSKTEDPFNQMFYELIESKLFYPEHNPERMINGFVLVSFQIEEDGSILVLELNSSSEEFRNAALQTLSEISLCSHASGNIYNMKFEYLQL
jgi:hypothetical protein